ncbi:MAG: PepSY domain-containing protein [Burkholderiales bacterium]|nr:PepSY domain-containing protein [Burkholderiales bacterium]
MALFLVVAGLTGSIIVFQDELDRWLNPRLLVVEPRGEPLAPAVLRGIAQRYSADAEVGQIPLRRAPDASAVFWMSPRVDPASGERRNPGFTALYLDPYSGAVLGTRNFGTQWFDREHILAFIYELHYTLALPEPWGRWLFGFVALLWVLDCLNGFYLTLPRRRRNFFSGWKPAWLIRFSRSPIRINFDLHRAAALWTWVMLLVLAVSSVQLNLYRELFGPLFTSFFPVSDVRGQLAAVPRPPRGYAPVGWDEALERARGLMAVHARQNGFAVTEETSLGLSRQRGIYAYRVRSTLDIDDRYGRTQIYFSAVDGRELVFEHPRLTRGDLILRWMTMLHFGHVWGMPFRLFVCAMGLIVTLLSITGVIIWLKKRRARAHAALALR